MGCIWGAPTEQLWLDAEAIAGILGTPSPKLAVIVDILPPALPRGHNPWHCQLAFGEGQPWVRDAQRAARPAGQSALPHSPQWGRLHLPARRLRAVPPPQPSPCLI